MPFFMNYSTLIIFQFIINFFHVKINIIQYKLPSDKSVWSFSVNFYKIIKPINRLHIFYLAPAYLFGFSVFTRESNGLRKRCAVHDFNRGFQIGLLWIKCQSNNPFHTMPQFSLTNPNNTAAIRIFFQIVLNRHIGRGSMMMWYVPLDAPRYPCAQHTDKSWFDDILPIEEI